MEVQASAALGSKASRMVQTDESGGVTVMERVRQSMVFQSTALPTELSRPAGTVTNL